MDRVARARAIACGSLLSGEVASIERDVIELVSTQPALRVRTGERVVLHGLGVSGEVVELERRGQSRSIRIRLAGPLPVEVGVGSHIETGAEVIDVPARAKATAWTHARPVAGDRAAGGLTTAGSATDGAPG